jgi:uncharacterized protein YdaT
LFTRKRQPETIHMPWTIYRYPAAMKNLPYPARCKAIEIANALLAEGYLEGRAIRIAIARAKEWYRHRAWRETVGNAQEH